jgi:ABC-2 type transport system permease protein
MTVSLGSARHVRRDGPSSTTARALRTVAHQAHYDFLSLVRNRNAQGSTLAMPIGFLILFVAIFGNGTIHIDGQVIKNSTYYVAALSVFAVVDVAFMSLLITLVEVREAGILRRRRATPQPAWTIIAGRAVTAVTMGIASAVLLLAVGRVAYGASLPLAAVPALLAGVLTGVVVFAILGFAVSGLVRSFQSAQPASMALALPLTFISGVFIPWVFIPHWLQHLSAIFPVRPLVVALLNPYLAHGGRSPWSPGQLLVLLAWGALGLVLALRRFSWAPRDI